jgi:small subunit ribosomal protein S1
MGSKYPIGTRLKRPIVKITNAGAFIQLEEGIDGFLHNDDLSWTQRNSNVGAEYQVGQEIDVMVINCDSDSRNIRLGIKQLSDDPWKSFASAYRIGSIVEGTVSSITDFGLFMKVPGEIEGLISKYNLTEDKTIPLEEEMKKYEVGTQIKAVIVELNAERQKLGLSIKDLLKKQQREEMSRFLHTEDSSDGFTLGDLLKERDSNKNNA